MLLRPLTSSGIGEKLSHLVPEPPELAGRLTDYTVANAEPQPHAEAHFFGGKESFKYLPQVFPRDPRPVICD